jgi:hypothetical protein
MSLVHSWKFTFVNEIAEENILEVVGDLKTLNHDGYMQDMCADI